VTEFRFRTVEPRDAAAIAALWVARRPQDPAQARVRAGEFIAEALEKGEFVAVAEEEGVLVAYARVARFERAADAARGTVPTGWYLLGISVREDRKRRGLGRALTARRLRWLREQGVATAYYFADFDNEASIRMHAEFGFAPVREDVEFPGMRRDSKPMVLYRLAPNSHEDARS
jgi:L-amino acid N-acyltransferase YncA